MLLLQDKNIAIFLSQKTDGDMLFKSRGARTYADWTLTDADKINEKVRQNRISFFKKNNIDPSRLVNLAGVHGAKIDTITRDSMLGSGALDPETRIKGVDGLITNIRTSYLMVTGADCFPVLLFDEKKKVIAALHAGWKGILVEIAPHAIKKFKEEFASNPKDIKVWIGPGIKKCHYDVSKERADLFSKNYKKYIINRDGKIFLDLPKIIILQLNEAGIKPENIIEYPDCTFCEAGKYFYYRRDRPRYIESQAFIIHLK